MCCSYLTLSVFFKVARWNATLGVTAFGIDCFRGWCKRQQSWSLYTNRERDFPILFAFCCLEELIFKFAWANCLTLSETYLYHMFWVGFPTMSFANCLNAKF
jgi:hypothetical protein